MLKEKVDPFGEQRSIFNLFLILAIAFLLRITGIGFGLPLRFHPDEWIQVLPALSIFEGSFHPGYFYYPSFTVYFYFFAFKTASLIVPEIFRFSSSNSSFWLLARIVSAFFGTAAVSAAYLLASRLYDRRTGLISAFFIAIFPLEVRHSHFAIVDIPMSLWVLFSLYFMCEKKDGTLSNSSLIFAGLFAGLASSAKYTALPLTAVLFIVSFLRLGEERKSDETGKKRIFSVIILFLSFGIIFLALSVNPIRGWINTFLTGICSADGIIEKGDLGYYALSRIQGIFRFSGFLLLSMPVLIYFIPAVRGYFTVNPLSRRIILPVVVSIAVFFAVSPYIVIEFNRFIYDLKFSMKVTTLGYYEDKMWRAEPFSSALTDFFLIFKNAGGITLTALSIAGMLFSLKKKFLPLFLWCGIYICIIRSWEFTMPRFLLPITPLLIIFSSGAITGISDILKRKDKDIFLKSAVMSILIVFASVTPLINSINVDKYFLKSSSLNAAFNWIEGNIPSGKKLLLAGTAPDMSLSEKQYRVVKMVNSEELYDVEEAFRMEGSDFLITGLPEKEIRRVLDEKAEEWKAQLIKSFFPNGDESTGPVIFIFKLRD